MDKQNVKVHLIPYNYSMIHQQPGVPLTNNKSPTYQLASTLAEPSFANNDSLVTEALLLQLTDCDTLEEVRVISLRNKQLTSCLRILAKCDSLSITYLQGNAINLQDLMYLQMFNNLKKIDLSYNSITSLPNGAVFSGLVNLKFLYLHNNHISNWNDITALTSLPQIMHLTLFSNPVCSIPGYRHFLVNSVNSLLALDNFIITDEERIEDASFGYRFRGLNEYMKLHIPDYAKEKSAEQHLFNLEVDIYRLRRIFERNSPSILIQSLYRGYRSRNFVKIYFNERKQKIVKIQKNIRGWLERKRFKKDLKDILSYTKQEYLLLSTQEIRQINASKIIRKHMIKWYKERRRENLKESACINIQKFVRGRIIKNTSFINALELDEYPRIYFLKEQKPLFQKILRTLIPMFANRIDISYEELHACIQEEQKYDTLRVAEPDLFKYKNCPIIQLVQPSMTSKIRFNKGKPLFGQESFSVTNMYFSNNKNKTDRTLSIIKRRNCQITKQRLLNDIKNSKRNPFKNQYLFQDQYKDFLVFESPRVEILITLCFAILEFNRLQAVEDESQFLVFFEKLLIKVSCATKIQQAYRAYKFRQTRQQLPIQRIIQQRAAYCIQRWWSDMKLQKRMIALQKIKRHIDKIQSKEIYIEETLYMNVNSIASYIHQQLKFEEQLMNFDFGINKQLYMYVHEKDKQIFRFSHQAVPRWYNLNFKAPDFSQSPYMNNILAFFHLNEGDCQILPSNYVLKQGHPHLDIDRNINFVQIQCASIEEAKRRAITLAYLTYNVHHHLFVQLNTAEMLEDPFAMSNIYKLHNIYTLQNTFGEKQIDIKSSVYQQSQQPHGQLILSQKDMRYQRLQNQVKSLPLSNRTVLLSFTEGAQDFDQIENELIMRDQRQHVDYKATLAINNYQSRKQQEENVQEIKERRIAMIKDSVSQFKEQQTEQKMLIQEAFDKYLVEKREEVNKAREINKIIQGEQKGELERNLAVFLNLNKEEKNLRKELVEKQLEVDFKEKYLKKVNVLQHHKNRLVKKEEQSMFINAFAQAKNLINKQIKIGKMIKQKQTESKDNKEKVFRIKNSRITDKSKEKAVLKSVLYDNSLNLSMDQSKSQIVNRQKKSIQNHNFQTEITAPDENGNTSRLGCKSAYNNQNKSYFLPPLNDTSFNEQYQTFKPSHQTFMQEGNDYDISREIQEIYKQSLPQRVNIKKNFQRPIFAEESYPLVKQNKTFDQNDIGGKFNNSFDHGKISTGRQKIDSNELRNSSRRFLINNNIQQY